MANNDQPIFDEHKEDEDSVPGPRSLEDAGRKSSFFPEISEKLLQNVAAPAQPSEGSQVDTSRKGSFRITSQDALQIGLLLHSLQRRTQFGYLSN